MRSALLGGLWRTRVNPGYRRAIMRENQPLFGGESGIARLRVVNARQGVLAFGRKGDVSGDLMG